MRETKNKKDNHMRIIAVFFSLLMPGVGQIYNNQIMKGIIFLLIEHYENIFGKINKAIQLDFNGYHQQALDVVNFDGILFYPGFYAFVAWDAWYHAKEGANKAISAIPFLIGGFLGLFGAIYASKLPFPAITVGLLMIIPIIIGTILLKKQ